jgi:hypothetical protein
MYWFDLRSGETVFELAAAAETPVGVLLAPAAAAAPAPAVPMTHADGRWTARLRLPAGLHAYAFQTGVKRWCERGVGTIRTPAGERFNLAVVPPLTAGHLRA